MKYVLNWNDEYLDQCIVCGPMDEAAARQGMKEDVIRRLVQLDVAEDEAAAERMYLDAERSFEEDTEEMDELHVSPYGASILYGSGYEERYQIVEY